MAKLSQNESATITENGVEVRIGDEVISLEKGDEGYIIPEEYEDKREQIENIISHINEDMEETGVKTIQKANKILMENNQMKKELEMLKAKLSEIETNVKKPQQQPKKKTYDDFLLEALGVRTIEEAEEIEIDDPKTFQKADRIARKKEILQEIEEREKVLPYQFSKVYDRQKLTEIIENDGNDPKEFEKWCIQNKADYNRAVYDVWKLGHKPKKSLLEIENEKEKLKRQKITILPKGNIPSSPQKNLTDMTKAELEDLVKNHPDDPRIVKWRKEQGW